MLKNERNFPADLEIIYDGEIETGEGTCGMMELGTGALMFTFPAPDILLREFCLIYGIGPATAERLQREGYHTLTDLLPHPRWGKAAAEIIRLIETRNLVRLSRYGATPMQLLSFFRPEEMLFFDIETAGLYYSQPLFVVGLLEFHTGRGRIRQFFIRGFEEERAVLLATRERLNNAGVVASYNGKSFDIPFLMGRMKFNHVDGGVTPFHLDILPPVRRTYRGVLPDCRLVTLEEQLLRRTRIGDPSGPEIAEVYFEYLETGDRRLVDLILRHNAYDLLSMAQVLGLLCGGE